MWVSCIQCKQQACGDVIAVRGWMSGYFRKDRVIRILSVDSSHLWKEHQLDLKQHLVMIPTILPTLILAFYSPLRIKTSR